jgi:hypothetical protein
LEVRSSGLGAICADAGAIKAAPRIITLERRIAITPH